MKPRASAPTTTATGPACSTSAASSPAAARRVAAQLTQTSSRPKRSTAAAASASTAPRCLPEALLLGRFVGDLQEVRGGQRGEHGGDEAGEARREEQADRERGDHPQPDAVGAD